MGETTKKDLKAYSSNDLVNVRRHLTRGDEGVETLRHELSAGETEHRVGVGRRGGECEENSPLHSCRSSVTNHKKGSER